MIVTLRSGRLSHQTDAAVADETDHLCARLSDAGPEGPADALPGEGDGTGWWPPDRPPLGRFAR